MRHNSACMIGIIAVAVIAVPCHGFLARRLNLVSQVTWHIAWAIVLKPILCPGIPNMVREKIWPLQRWIKVSSGQEVAGESRTCHQAYKSHREHELSNLHGCRPSLAIWPRKSRRVFRIVFATRVCDSHLARSHRTIPTIWMTPTARNEQFFFAVITAGRDGAIFPDTASKMNAKHMFPSFGKVGKMGSMRKI